MAAAKRAIDYSRAKVKKYQSPDEIYMKKRFALEAALTNNRDGGHIPLKMLLTEAKEIEKFLNGEE